MTKLSINVSTPEGNFGRLVDDKDINEAFAIFIGVKNHLPDFLLHYIEVIKVRFNSDRKIFIIHTALIMGEKLKIDFYTTESVEIAVDELCNKIREELSSLFKKRMGEIDQVCKWGKVDLLMHG